MTNKMRNAGKIGIPIALIGVMVSALIWLSTRAIAMENRVTKCETRIDVLLEIRADIKEMKHDVQTLLIRTQRLEDAKKTR